MRKQRESAKQLETTSEVMKVLGGPARVAALTGARYKLVWQWGKDPTFPSKYFAVMSWALRKKRLRASPALWDQVMIPEMEKAAA